MKPLLLISLLLAAAPALADESTIALKPGAGQDTVMAGCSGCHSLDYIQMNSPFLGATAWDATVAKMIRAFGAPIDDADAKIIGEYLKKNYSS